MSQQPQPRDDTTTVVALAILSGCGAVVAHEALGHGSACLLSGGRITQLTSVYFACSRGNIWVPLGGPIGNLATGLLSWLALASLMPHARRARVFFVLLMAFSFFWAAGYLLYSMVLGVGDYAIAIREALGSLPLSLRIGGILLAGAFYAVAIRITAAETRDFRPALLRLSWTGASAAICLAGLAYAPDRSAAFVQSALELGAASLPLLGIARRIEPRLGRSLTVARSQTWIGAAIFAYAAFVLTLGRGLP